jgi:YYY domain-containing protein
MVAGLGRLVFHPFFAHFASAYGTVELWRGSRTSLGAFLLIHGFFVFTLTSFFLFALWSGPRLAPAARRTLAAGTAVTAGLATAGLGVEAALAGLATLALGFLAQPGRSGPEQMLAVLTLLGAALSGAVEHLVLKGDIGRMNTVFKLYLQVWVLWGVASAASLAQMRSLWRREVSRGLPVLWGGVWVALFVGALVYPLLATPARLCDRIEGAAGRGLDGQAFMAQAVIRDQGPAIPLAGDAAALRWLQEHVSGSPVIVEASLPPYRWGSRVSVNTGLPTIVGWDTHQRQQRAVLKDDAVGRRLADVRTIYTNPDSDAVLPILRRYGARYVYVGLLERLHYPGVGLSKFDRDSQHWRRVYENAHVSIYRLAEP